MEKMLSRLIKDVRIIKVLLYVFTFFIFVIEINAQGSDNERHYLGVNKNKLDTVENWSFHFQSTIIVQGHPDFHSPYSGANSLRDTAETALSLTNTFFLGRKLWKGAALFFNPEIAGGKGISYALGIAGAANGETFRIGSPAPALYIARLFFQQHIALNSKRENAEDDLNQLKSSIPSSRITISAGKFSIADYFDDNSYSHDPRTEFLNWSLMSNGAWDYPANTRGYTWGAVVELVKPGYAIRISSVMMPKIANGPTLDFSVNKAHAETVEFEKKISTKKHQGSLKFLAFHNSSRAPSYNNAINAMTHGDSSLNEIIEGRKTGTTFGGIKYGFGLNFCQELTNAIGIFARLGWNNGQTATWAFTEIDQTASAGISIKASKIKRPEDVFGLAIVVNGISKEHINYLNAGGYGFIIGDGKLPNYGHEQILETFYKIKLAKTLWTTLDYQFIANPAYNKDRGPVHVFAIRGHVEF
ncbi:MAG TPA: carbohydrate porin [Cytophagaceae bacterium]|nr:carbohydrate porin [Cytophagaceae bacterium]